MGSKPASSTKFVIEGKNVGKKKQDQVRRAIKINQIDGDGQILELSKATAVRTDKNMIHLDQLEDGTWRLIYNANLIPDITKVLNLEIVRED